MSSRHVVARRWRVGGVTALLLAVVLMIGHYAYRNAAHLADWYAAFAAQHLPEGASSFGPVASDRGAFFFCARQVARSMEGELSVETFATPAADHTQPLGSARFRVTSFVDEDRLDGARVRHGFTCVVRLDGTRWVLEELKLTDR